MDKNIVDEIRKTVNNIKDMKKQMSGINNYLNILEGMLRTDNQRITEEAYQKGYKACMQENDFDSPCTSCEAYQRGVEDGQNETWETAKKVALCAGEGGLSIEELDEIFGCSTLQQVFRRYSAQQTIEKLKKADDEIKVGDEVTSTLSKTTYTVVSFGEYEDGALTVCGFDSHGVWHGNELSELHKTGKHYDIDRILEEMKK